MEDNNVYTVLLGVASVALLAAVVYTFVRMGTVFGTYNPLDLVS